MFGPKCLKPRPVPCGGVGVPVAPLPTPVAPVAPVAPGPVLPYGGACQTSHAAPEVVVEPAVFAAPNVFHHHKKVEHIVPVVTQDVHHYHAHHNYVVKEEKQAAEVYNHNHGLCGAPTVPAPQPCGPTPGCGF